MLNLYLMIVVLVLFGEHIVCYGSKELLCNRIEMSLTDQFKQK